MKKILFATHSPYYIGGERSMWDVLTGIKDKYEVALLTRKGELWKMAKKQNITLFELPLPDSDIWRVKRGLFLPLFKKEIIKILKELRKIIEKYNPDLIYTHSMKMHLFFSIPFVRKNKKLVWHFRDVPEEVSKFVFRLFAIFPFMIITISERVKDFFYLGKNKIRVVYNGIRIPNGFIDNEIKKEKFTILSVGNIQHWKGQDIIIECAKKLKDFEFWIVGDAIHPGEDKFKKKLIEKVRKENIKNVRFFGKRDDVFSFYKKCDIFLHVPREREGFGRVLVEAMAFRKPIVATAVAAVPEIVGDAGLLAKKESINDICEKIIRLYKDKKLQKNLSDRGYKRYKELFTIDKMIEGVKKCLEEII